MSDPVQAPAHYVAGGIETIDYIAAKLGPDGFRAHCIGCVLKYVSRWQHKDGEQDLEKARVYLGWAIAKAPLRDGVAKAVEILPETSKDSPFPADSEPRSAVQE